MEAFRCKVEKFFSSFVRLMRPNYEECNPLTKYYRPYICRLLFFLIFLTLRLSINIRFPKLMDPISMESEKKTEILITILQQSAMII